jgi:hypothetical protein
MIFAKENLNVVAQFADWATGGDVDSSEDGGTGRGSRDFGEGSPRSPLYRDEQGALHERSAVCTISAASWPGTGMKRPGIAPCHGFAL